MLMQFLCSLRDKSLEWLNRYADHAYASKVLAIISFIEAIFFPIPPDVFILPLSIKCPAERWHYAGITTMASIVGGIVGYAIGALFFHSVGQPIIDFYNLQAGFDSIGRSFQDNAFTAMFLAGFTPIPFKVFTLAAGVFLINFPIFIVASLISRGLRFAIVSWIAAEYGERVGKLIYKYFNLATLFFAIIVLVYLLIH